MPSNAAIAGAVGLAGAAAYVYMRQRGSDAEVETSPSKPQRGYHEARRTMKVLPCGVKRVAPDVHKIRVDANNIGTDLIREWQVQRQSYVAHYGGELVPDPITFQSTKKQFPRLPPRCAAEVLDLWLRAWRTAWEANPKNFRILKRRWYADPTGRLEQFDPEGTLRRQLDLWAIGDAEGSLVGKQPTYPSDFSDLGVAVRRAKELRQEAVGMVAIPSAYSAGVAAAQGAALLALRLDNVGLRPRSASSEAWDELKDTMSSLESYEHVVEMTAEEVGDAASKVAKGAGNVFGAFMEGFLTSDILPILVIGTLIYVVAIR